MDPEPGADAAAMAAAMGFSTFGAQDRPQKKRRYNPAVDAATFVEQNSRGPRAATTGSNSTPLGKHVGASKVEELGNGDEINLEDEDEGENQLESVKDAISQDDSTEVVSHTASVPGLPARPAPGTGFVGSLPHGSGGRENVSKPQSSKIWYEGYYDSTSNENPWERLEKIMGLGTKGSWIPRQTHTVPSV